MAKPLKDILSKKLEGVKSSAVVSGSIGVDPGVDYKPKAGDEQKFVDIHSTEKHADRVGNKDDIYKATNVKYSLDTPENKRMGKKLKSSEKDEFKPNTSAPVKEAKEDEEAKCNHSRKGVKCPVHGMVECAEAVKINETGQIDEILTKNTPVSKWISDFIHSEDPKFAGKSKKERTKQALAAYYAKQRNEDLAMPLLGDMPNNSGGSGGSPGGTQMMTDDTEEEIKMVRAELKAIANKAMHLLIKMPEHLHIEPWIQAKIAKAKMAVSEVHDHMLYSDEHQEREQADTPIRVPTEIHNTFPGLNQDNALGMNV